MAFRGGRGGGRKLRGGVAPVSTVRTGSLSDRFTQLALQQQKAFKNTSIGGTESRRVTIQGQQQFKREAMQNARRQGGDFRAAGRNAGGRGGGGGGRGGGGVRLGRGGKPGVRGGRGGGGRGGGRGRGGGKGEKPASKEDLDAQMDSYWHEAGKGPDPKVLKEERAKVNLDAEMDDYWKAKEAKAAAPAEETAAEA